MNLRTRLPAEWEKQSAVIITWPHEKSDWANYLDDIEKTYLQLAQTILHFEKLVIICYDESHLTYIKKQLVSNHIDLSQIYFSQIKTNDTWIRDYGPITLVKENNEILDFQFNAWGNKFDATLDNKVTAKLIQNKTINTKNLTTIDFILEAGSIDCDGRGTLLTTSTCLLNNSRNPSYSKDNIIHFIENTLGINKISWLDYGFLAGDDTDFHIDMLARFTDENTIAYVKCNDINDEHYEDNVKMETQLKTFLNWQNKPYHLIALPFPQPIFSRFDNRRLPASYANFLIINDAVLVPLYEDINDKAAMDILAKCFPDREIIGIPFLSAIEQNGSLHCLTMQLPEGYL